MLDNNSSQQNYLKHKPKPPKNACLPMNRCNVPARVLASVMYQQKPIPVSIDGIPTAYAKIWTILDQFSEPGDRARRFIDIMSVHFCLHELKEAGCDNHSRRARPKADYRRAFFMAKTNTWSSAACTVLRCFLSHRHDAAGKVRSWKNVT